MNPEDVRRAKESLIGKPKDEADKVKEKHVHEAFGKEVEHLVSYMLSSRAMDQALDNRLYETDPEEFDRIWISYMADVNATA